MERSSGADALLDESSSGADALLDESWTTPWLDERVFPYWPQAARIGDREDFLRWLVVQDSRRAALVLAHATEFEKVHRLVTKELSRPKRHQQQLRQQPPRRKSQSARPLASSTAARTRARGGTGGRATATTSAKALTSPTTAAGDGEGGGKWGGSGGGLGRARGAPFSSSNNKNNSNNNNNNNSSSSINGAGCSPCPREPSAAAKSDRLSVASGGSGGYVGGGRGRGKTMSRSWPPSGVARTKQKGVLRSRHKTTGTISPSPMARSRGSRGDSAHPPPGAAAQPPWSPSTSKTTAVAGAYQRASIHAAPKSRPWGSLEVGDRRATTEGRAGAGAGSGSLGGRGSGSRRGGARESRDGAVRIMDGRVSGVGGASGARPELSSWGPAASVAVATAAAGRTAMARRVAEAAVAEAEAEAATTAAAAVAAKATGTGRGKRVRGGLSPEKHHSAEAAGLARGRSRQSSPPFSRTDGDSGNASSGHGLKGAGGGPAERFRLEDVPAYLGLSGLATPGLNYFDEAESLRAGASSDLLLGRAGSRVDRPREVAAAEHLSPGQQTPARFHQRSHPLLGSMDEEMEGMAPPPSPPPPPPPPEKEEAADRLTKDERENGGQSWLRMRDPVSQRDFWFDPETRAAVWEGGGAMEDTPGGMGLGLLSWEERERLKGKFERRQRRVRRASGGPGGAVPAVGISRGTAGLRELVLRKLTLEGGSGESSGGGGGGGSGGRAASVPPDPVRRGAATHGVFFS
eukprot:g5929.t1